ncbi:hypothetical protein L1887_18308 [Cichorium endivia]|nr:hypothetical protein L1887_18308 [Cichorium endivia]
MALRRNLLYKKPIDGLLEMSERVYVFDCCFTTDAWEQEDYEIYVEYSICQLKDNYPDASILILNFGGVKSSQFTSAYDMIVMDYPRQYQGCPLLPMDVIHHFLTSSERWLSRRQQNIILMHCEHGGWPVLAYMMAALLIYRKQFTNEYETLDMVYNLAPRDIVMECISLHDLLGREKMMFRVVFNTAFIRSNILMLGRDEIEMLWDAKDLFPKDFRAELLFSDMDTASSTGLPIDEFAELHKIYNEVDWLDPDKSVDSNIHDQGVEKSKSPAAVGDKPEKTQLTLDRDDEDEPKYEDLDDE